MGGMGTHTEVCMERVKGKHNLGDMDIDGKILKYIYCRNKTLAYSYGLGVNIDGVWFGEFIY
jgi:hypothetical protein